MNWDYLAGFFDGEGTIPACFEKRNLRLSYQFSIVNTNQEVIENVRQFLLAHGSKAAVYYSSRKRQPNHNPTWMVSVTDVTSLLIILPELEKRCTIKKAGIQKAIEWAKTIKPSTPRHSAETYAKANAMYDAGASAAQIHKEFGIRTFAFYSHRRKRNFPVHYPKFQKSRRNNEVSAI